MQKNDYLLAKFGVDTAENEPLRARLRARLNIGVHGVFVEDREWSKRILADVLGLQEAGADATSC